MVIENVQINKWKYLQFKCIHKLIILFTISTQHNIHKNKQTNKQTYIFKRVIYKNSIYNILHLIIKHKRKSRFRTNHFRFSALVYLSLNHLTINHQKKI